MKQTTDKELQPYIPDTLYKYIPIFSTNREESEKYFSRLRKIIIHNIIYFQAPKYFNDPFDCKSNLAYARDPEIIKNHMNRTIKIKTPGKFNKRERASIIKKEMKTYDYKKYESTFNEGVRKKIGIFCLTEFCDSILMWSHYANNHKGVCLAFDMTISENMFNFAGKVKYSDNYPSIKDLTQAHFEENTKNTVFTKAKEWEYEEERRILRPPQIGGAGDYLLTKNNIKGVILGAKIENDDCNKVIEIVKKSRKKLELCKAELDDEKYQLNIKPISY